MLDVSEETMEGKEEDFVDCHSLLHQYSLSLLNHSQPPASWSKRKRKIQKKRRTKILHYIMERNPNLLLSNPNSGSSMWYL